MEDVVLTKYVLTDNICKEMFPFRQGPGNCMYEHKLCTEPSRTIGKPPVEAHRPCSIVWLTLGKLGARLLFPQSWLKVLSLSLG